MMISSALRDKPIGLALIAKTSRYTRPYVFIPDKNGGKVFLFQTKTGEKFEIGIDIAMSLRFWLGYPDVLQFLALPGPGRAPGPVGVEESWRWGQLALRERHMAACMAWPDALLLRGAAYNGRRAKECRRPGSLLRCPALTPGAGALLSARRCRGCW